MRLASMLAALLTALPVSAIATQDTGRFHCVATDFLRIEVMGTYSLAEGRPMIGDFTVIIEDTPFAVTPERVSKYVNSSSSSGHSFELIARRKKGPESVLNVNVTNGIGETDIDGWGIRFENVPTTCTFTGI